MFKSEVSLIHTYIGRASYSFNGLGVFYARYIGIVIQGVSTSFVRLGILADTSNMCKDQPKHARGAKSLAKEEIGKVLEEIEMKFPSLGKTNGNVDSHRKCPCDHGNATKPS